MDENEINVNDIIRLKFTNEIAVVVDKKDDNLIHIFGVGINMITRIENAEKIGITFDELVNHKIH